MKYVAIIFLSLICISSFGQLRSLGGDDADSLFEIGEHDKAIDLCNAAVSEAKSNIRISLSNFEWAIRRAASFYEAASQQQKTVWLYETAIQTVTDSLGKEKTYYLLSFLANAYHQSGQYDKAVAAGEKAVELATQARDPNIHLYTDNLAAFYYSAQDFNRAYDTYKRTISIGSDYEVDETLANKLYSFSLVCGQLYRYSEAAPYAEKALRYFQDKEKGSDWHLLSAINLASIYQYTGKTDSAIALLEMVLRKQDGTFFNRFPPLLQTVGGVYATAENFEKALHFSQRYIDAIRTTSNEVSVALAYAISFQGSLYQESGDYVNSLREHNEVLRILDSLALDTSELYSQSLHALSNIYSDMGAIKKAIVLLNRALNISIKLYPEDHPIYLQGLTQLAELLYFSDDKINAKRIATDVLNKCEKADLKQTYYYLKAKRLLMSLYSKEDNDKAIQLGRQAIILANQLYGEDHLQYGAILNDIGNVYMSIGSSDSAIKYYELAARIIEKQINNEDNLSNNLTSIATAEALRNRATEAAQAISKSLILWQKQINEQSAFLTPGDLVKYIQSRFRSIETAYNIAAKFRNNELLTKLLDIELFIKGRGRNTSRTLTTLLRTTTDKDLLNLGRLVAQTKSKLNLLYGKGEQRAIDSLLLLQEKYEQLLISKLPIGFSDPSKTKSWKEIQTGLQKNEAAVCFVAYRLRDTVWANESAYAAYIIRPGKSDPVFVPLFVESELNNLLDSAGNTPTQQANNLYRSSIIKQAGTPLFDQRLYSLLWAPLEPYLDGCDKIAYCPAGKLHNVAFHVLRPDSGKLLMDRYQLRQYAHLQDLVEATNDFSKTSNIDITLFGNPSFTMLHQDKDSTASITQVQSFAAAKNNHDETINWKELPGTEMEVEAINSMFSAHDRQTKVFMGSGATETNVVQLDGQSSRIIHFATHGFYKKVETDRNSFDLLETKFSDNPLQRSGLVLAGANNSTSGIDGQDGILTAYEIAQLDLSNTEVVVLSACETGLGSSSSMDREGVNGLQSALKIAGVDKLIVSLWQVPDKETAELMTLFYNNYLNGASVENAFRNAQQAMKSKYPPYYWAAFVMIH